MPARVTPGALVEPARAKVNLTLRVLGRRSDGYHQIESLVAFADVGDVVSLEPGDSIDLKVEGPFAGAIDGENLVRTAAAQFAAACPGARLGRFRIEKWLPVAAGLGGGSADAAAALRLLVAANPGPAAGVDLSALARRIGADVPVCFAGVTASMQGIGETVVPAGPMARVPALLVCPPAVAPTDKTAAVFKALAASPYRADGPLETTRRPRLDTIADVIHTVTAGHNDLTRAASVLMPAVCSVLEALERLPQARVARLSGAGPTAFALFERSEQAEAAAALLGRAEPGWWIAPTLLG